MHSKFRKFRLDLGLDRVDTCKLKIFEDKMKFYGIFGLTLVAVSFKTGL